MHQRSDSNYLSVKRLSHTVKLLSYKKALNALL